MSLSIRRLPFRAQLQKKMAHNLQASISRLPPEVLSVIFCHLRDSFLDFIKVNQDPFIPLSYHEPWRWSIVMQVCYAWRMSALNTPALWSHIVLSSDSGGRWAQEMCRLSKQTPLNIILHNVNSLGHEIMKHLGRCRTLSLRQGNLNKVLPNIDTSCLEYLLISDFSVPTETPFIFCDDILHAESLRRLRLHACYIDWDSTLLRRLTHLTLDCVRAGCRLSCSDFVAFLSTIPALEALHLSKFLKEEDSDDVPFSLDEMAKTRLQNLKYLDLLCVVHEMANFLCRLDLPSSCRLSLWTCDEAKEITPTFCLILSWLAHHFRPPQPSSTIPDGDLFMPQSALRSLCLRHSSPYLKVQGFFKKLSNSDLLGVREPTFEFSTIWGLKESEWKFPRDLAEFQSSSRLIIDDTILRPFLTSLPLEHLAHLEVSNGPDLHMSEDIWLKVFGSIRTMEQILLDGDALPFLCALTPHPSALYLNFRRPFPALSSIAYNDSLDFTSILSCLQARSASGLALQEFLFPGGCTIPPSTREKLEKVVSYVGFHSMSGVIENI